jgi:hypothetical protein
MDIDHYSDEFRARFPGRTTRLTSIEQFALLEAESLSPYQEILASNSQPQGRQPERRKRHTERKTV